MEPEPETSRPRPRDRPLPRTTTVEQVAAELRARILGGRLRPGTRLREQALADSLGVSRNTLREALRRLAAERLLDYEAHRGVAVRMPTPEDIHELIELRRLIELAALRACDPRDGRELEVLAMDARDAGASGDEARIVEADMRFHARLVASLGNRRLDEVYAGVTAEMRLALFVLEPEQPADWADHHIAVSRHLASGDDDAAATDLSRHLDAIDESLRRRFGASASR